MERYEIERNGVVRMATKEEIALFDGATFQSAIDLPDGVEFAKENGIKMYRTTFRRCTSCGAELGSDWDAATVHIDRDSGITCGGKIQ